LPGHEPVAGTGGHPGKALGVRGRGDEDRRRVEDGRAGDTCAFDVPEILPHHERGPAVAGGKDAGRTRRADEERGAVHEAAGRRHAARLDPDPGESDQEVRAVEDDGGGTGVDAERAQHDSVRIEHDTAGADAGSDDLRERGGPEIGPHHEVHAAAGIVGDAGAELSARAGTGDGRIDPTLGTNERVEDSRVRGRGDDVRRHVDPHRPPVPLPLNVGATAVGADPRRVPEAKPEFGLGVAEVEAARRLARVLQSRCRHLHDEIAFTGGRGGEPPAELDALVRVLQDLLDFGPAAYEAAVLVHRRHRRRPEIA
jgi:hypothetical protein